MMFNYGDFVQLKDGRIVFIRPVSTKNSITLEEAKNLHKRGEIIAKSEFIDGDEVIQPLDKIK